MKSIDDELNSDASDDISAARIPQTTSPFTPAGRSFATSVGNAASELAAPFARNGRKLPIGIQSFEDLDGKTVATEVSSTTVEIAEGYGASITPITGSEEAVQMVLTKRSDAVILPEVMFYQLLRENPDIALKSVDTLEDAEIAAIPVNKGEERLVEALNQALDELRADGTLAKISEQYFGYDLSSN